MPCRNCGGTGHNKRTCKHSSTIERKSLKAEKLKKRLAPATLRGRAQSLVQTLALEWNLPIEVQNLIEFHCHLIENCGTMNVCRMIRSNGLWRTRVPEYHVTEKWWLWRTMLLKPFNRQSVDHFDAIDGLPSGPIFDNTVFTVPIPAGNKNWQRRQWPEHRTPISFGGYKGVALSNYELCNSTCTANQGFPLQPNVRPYRCYAEPTSTGFKLTYLHAAQYYPTINPEMLRAFRHNFETWRKLD